MPPADPFVAALEECCGLLMRRSMLSFFRYARRSGLSMSQSGALLHLYQQGDCGVKDLGAMLGISSAASSQMLDRLVEQGLIERSEDPTDRRVRRIALTEQGRAMARASIQIQQAWFADLADGLAAAEKEQITAALNLLIDRVRQFRLPAEA